MNNENFSADNNPAPTINAQTQADTFVFHAEPRAVDAGEGVN